jgi:predicted phosphoribosyltransferase
MAFFLNREDAGRQLAAALAAYRGAQAVVFALPRGGVVLGAVVARSLGLPLDVLTPRKVGHPLNPEYAICAVSGSGKVVCNEDERAAVDPHWLDAEVERQRAESTRRHALYGAGTGPLDARTAILVDDGIATGLTMRAAIREVRHRRPARVVVAIPVIPPQTAETLRQEADEVVALEIPTLFFSARWGRITRSSAR